MTIVAHSRPFVIGVDTHAKTHTYAVIDTASGQLLGCEQFPTTPPGIARAISWAGRLTGGDAATLWSIEGVATYGARLAHAVADHGYEVVEAPRMNAKTRHGVGKSDPLDARAIATAVLPLEDDRLRHPRADDGARQALRVLVAARDQMAAEKTMNVNALTALLRTKTSASTPGSPSPCSRSAWHPDGSTGPSRSPSPPHGTRPFVWHAASGTSSSR